MASEDKYQPLKNVYLLEKHRLESFKDWPFDEKSSCSISRMAEAGFYWTGNKRENDTATCFVCKKTLDGWEATDDPWREHAKHAPQCSFVQYGKKESELLLNEFLQIYRTVLRNKVQNYLMESKSKISKEANGEMDEYLHKK